MNLEEARRLFFDEAADLLARMEQLLLQMEEAPAEEQTLAALFRCAHTIKGSAGIFGFEDVVTFMHGVEAELSLVRNGDRTLDGPSITILLECKDHAQRLLQAASRTEDAGEPLRSAGAVLLGRLTGSPIPAGSQDSLQQRRTADGPEGTARYAQESGGATPLELGAFELYFRPGVDVFRRGLDPLTAVRQLAKFAELTNVRIELQPQAELDPDPEACHISLRVSFRTDSAEDRILGLFEFFRSDSEIELTRSRLTPPATANSISVQAPESAPVRNAATVETGETHTRARSGGRAAAGFVRVDTAKLDGLINLVGELVIAGAHMHELAGHTGDGAVLESSRSLSRMISDLRDQSLRVRMVPLSEAFARFHRAVRETALSTGKEARLEVRVGDSEMDKNLIEAIADPLLHIIRNAVDHGIEMPEVRRALGKTPQGTVGIRSYRETGSIVLEIWDDGHGFDIEQITKTARRRGLASPERELTETEALRLLFRPGFSTREQVSSISGRGVGMDVVQKGIEALRGTVHVENRPTGGSLTRVRLPLTLAIIEGFLVRVGQSPYVIPMELVTECVEFHAGQLSGENDVLLLRDELLPFVRPAELFGETQSGPTRENVVVVEYADRRVGLIVQGLLGEFQAVIKPLNRMFSGLRGIGGATILGDGSVALILDIPSLIDYVVGRQAAGVGEAR